MSLHTAAFEPARQQRNGQRIGAEALLALIGAIGMTCVIFMAIIPSITHALPDDLLDPLSQTWVIAWYTHILPTAPTHLWDANIFYPAHATFTYQDTLLGWAPLAMPLLVVSANPVLTYNVLFLLSFSLCHWFTFLSVRALLRRAGYSGSACALAAFLGGTIYAYLPYKTSQLGHLNVLSAQWVPLIFLCWERGWARAGLRWWLGLGASLVLQALCCLYLAAFGAVSLAVLFVLRCCTPRGRENLPWRGLLTTTALTAVALLPLGIPYLQTSQRLGRNRPLAETATLAPSLSDLLHSSPHSILYGWTDHLFPPSSIYAPQYLFPGLTAAVLAVRAAWIVLRRHALIPRNGRTATRAGAGASGLARSLPQGPSSLDTPTPSDGARGGDRARTILWPYLVLWPTTLVLAQGFFLRLSSAPHSPTVPGPYAVLYRLVPAFRNFRDTGRFTVIAGFCLALLAAAGLASVLQGLETATHGRTPLADTPASRRVGKLRPGLITAVLTALVLLESLDGTIAMYPIATGTAVPPVYRWLAHRADGAPVLELPIGRYDLGCLSTYYSTYHWHPIVNGSSGFSPPAYTAALPTWATFPSPAAVRLLRRWTVRYVVVHGAWMGWAAALRIRAQALARHLRPVGRWGMDSVYEVPV